MRFSIMLIAVFLISHTGFSAVIYVPDDYGTINEAILYAQKYDTVIVRPGIYVENIDFHGKPITVRSEKGPGLTVIDGNRAGSVVTFENGEKNDSVLKGFHLTNGLEKGGGVYCDGCSPSIIGNIITYNESKLDGGGILCKSADALIAENVIMHNLAGNSGGGIWCGSGAVPSPTIVNNIIAKNTAQNWEGGGIYVHGENMTPFIINNTIVGNAAYGCLKGGGLRMTIESPVCNNIVWGNIPNQIAGYGDVTYCDVQGGWPGTGNIDADPLFVDFPNEDFHLTWPSACRDVGDNGMATQAHDFEGDPRIAYGTVDMGADEFYTHLYVTGNKTPGGNVEAKFVGLPGTTPVGLWFGSGVLDPPMQSMFGPWYLEPPWIGPVVLSPIPSPEGVLILSSKIHRDPPPPYDIFMQALIGLNPDSLTNLYVLEVR